MATRQYIGARYVPKFYVNSVDGSTLWEGNVVYEPLIFVTLQNAHMYLSKKQVPATVGSPANNVDYWLDVGSYNGFIEALQDQIDAHTLAITGLETKTANMKIYNVLDYGATGDDATDDTTAINSAVADIPNGGGILYFPAGRYKITAPIHITKKVFVFGASGSTVINLDDDSAVLYVDANYSAIRDITIVPTENAVNATGLKLTGSMFHVQNVNITKCKYNCHLDGCANAVFEQCYFTSPSTASVYIENAESPDTGDHAFIGCTFDSSAQTGKAIYFKSGGGMKVSSCKFLHHNTQIDIAPDSGVNTSVMLIEGNSFETSETQAIQLGGSAGSFSKVNIVGNQFSVKTHAIRLLSNASYVKIADNIIEKIVNDNNAAFVLSGAQYVTINDNTLYNFNLKIQALTRIAGLYINNNKGRCITPFSLVQQFKDLTQICEEVEKELSDDTGTVDIGALVVPQGEGCQLDISIVGSISGVGFVNKKASYLIGYNGATYQVTEISNKYTSNDITLTVAANGAISFTYSGTSFNGRVDMVAEGTINVISVA